MSTDDKDDMHVYDIIHKLDLDGNLPLRLNVPPEKEPLGTAFDEVDNFNLYKDNTPAGRLRASKRSLG